MAYYPSGAIKAYMNLKSIVNACFSDRTRSPYVTVGKWCSIVTVTIRREAKITIHNIEIGDVDRLNKEYEELYRMAHRS